MKELPKAYDYRGVEEKWYRYWEEKGFFKPKLDPNRPHFSVVIPPPNVTGKLHIGHALNNTLQDVIVRYKRMDGYDTLWLPGTDHAGIATQNVVEKALAKEGISRHDIGREEFLKRVWQWKEEYGGAIIEQLKRLGCSCDWSRQRFTMDEGLSQAVREVFVRLWEEGLIYRGDYIINWCPRCHTALADIEVEHEPTPGHLWYIRYPLVDGSGYIVVATTRPETMLGDTAVAVNPEDERYRHLIGKKIKLPLIGREIPIIADKEVDPEFGTGAVKVTPAHDFADFEIARRHNLPFVKVMDEDGKMTKEAGPYAGLDRFTARQKVVEDLETQGLLEKIEDYEVVLGKCYRCDDIVEPLLSKQWFVKTKPLATPAIAAVERGFTRLVPENWKNLYYDWMYNIRDWCISRQIWWGHRIPAWTCKDCGETTVSRNTPEVCAHCGSTNIHQEEDVLDTWFSSALWPFSTLGWPEDTPELRLYYPTSLLVTSFDILFFWVARMLMMGIHFMGAVPFRDVYVHALVRDEKGQKMSKSRGNVIDPLVMIEKYGTDAFRFTLVALAAQGRDIKLAESRIEGYRHFVNKIWNAARFVLMNLDNDFERVDLKQAALPKESRWILSRLSKTVAKVRQALDNYEFDQAALTSYHFFWHEFCDWYVEMSKRFLSEGGEARKLAQNVLVEVLETSLRLLHPFMPFVTEEIWQAIPHEGESIMVAPYPKPIKELEDDDLESEIEKIKEAIVAIRAIRADYNLHPTAKIKVILRAEKEETLKLFEEFSPVIKLLARLAEIELVKGGERPRGAAQAVLAEAEIFVPLEGLVDIKAELKKLAKEEEKVLKELSRVKSRLENEGFLKKAPKEVIEKEKARRQELEERLSRIHENMKRLKELA
ncbi:valyl-tRNA synthetase [Thermodesulfatator indicus DSM 15286]|uniref:Valine--tRNA ligase n=1 Tax=Thermodesulfatator indicus (strain DSM 15286 / JCM 11887 / CIR29812) TaxID=667014 RepID=F8AD52_THEID|nr:valine--tRNA ligase [Thermodesulfatator indicus]AEH44784.1 valyl-tRNA synthetase [Thermodesulfatator indicus DSM 15286]